MRGNTKAVMEAAKRHFLSFYRGNGGAKGMIADGEAAGGYTDYHKGKKLALGGNYLIYLGDVKEAVRKIMKQTKAEAAKYSDEKAWQQYLHLAGKAYEAIKKEKSKPAAKKRKPAKRRAAKKDFIDKIFDLI